MCYWFLLHSQICRLMHIWSWSSAPNGNLSSLSGFKSDRFPFAFYGCSLISVALPDVFSYFWEGCLWDLSTSEEQVDLSSIQWASKKLKQKHVDLETWTILSAYGAVVSTCPSKLAHKLQGEEASPEGSIKQTLGSFSQTLNSQILQHKHFTSSTIWLTFLTTQTFPTSVSTAQ